MQQEEYKPVFNESAVGELKLQDIGRWALTRW